ncbi:chloride channel protein [Aquirufa lenticrescens]
MARIKAFLLNLGLLVALSFATGSLSSLFLAGLDWIQHNGSYLYALPLVGLIFQSFKVPAYLIIPATWLSHLAGASVGREGTAVTMGRVLGEKIPESPDFSKALFTKAGMAAGFASVFGTPLAGAFFALEVGEVGKINFRHIPACLLAAFFANYVSLHVYGIKHLSYPSVFLPEFSSAFCAKLALLGLFLALIAFLYKRSESIIISAFDKLPVQGPLKGILAGLILFGVFNVPVFHETIGLSSEFLLRPFTSVAPDFALWKLLATNLSLGLGFKGGEATPLFLIGSHAASGFASWLALPLGLSAAIGFVSLYGGLAKTPLAATFLGMELFGPSAWFIYFIITLIVIFGSGKKGIFSNQTWADYLPKPIY